MVFAARHNTSGAVVEFPQLLPHFLHYFNPYLLVWTVRASEEDDAVVDEGHWLLGLDPLIAIIYKTVISIPMFKSGCVYLWHLRFFIVFRVESLKNVFVLIPISDTHPTTPVPVADVCCEDEPHWFMMNYCERICWNLNGQSINSQNLAQCRRQLVFRNGLPSRARRGTEWLSWN